MKIHTRLVWLLCFLMLIFMGVVIIQRNSEQDRLILLLKSVRVERESIFDKVLSLKETSLQTLSYDYSFWDEMVNFVTAPNEKWAIENIDVSLTTFKANAAWVYNLDHQLVYSVNNLEEVVGLKEIPIPKAAISVVFAHTPFCHFFVNTSKGLMEFYGAIIQPSSDVKRETPAKGYFFCSRLWDKSYIDDLSQLTNSRLVIADNVESRLLKSGQNKVSFLRVLTGWDNKPVKYLIISIVSQAIEGTKRAAVQTSLLFIIFLVITLAIVYFFITFWVVVPLELISLALKQENSIPLKIIEKQGTEFGDVSRMIGNFFAQREKIVQEITERKKMEEKLSRALEEEVKSRGIMTSMLADNNQVREKLEMSLKKLKNVQDQLIHAEKMEAIGRMASGVAHEVKNPLGIILQGINYFEGVLPPKEKDNYEILQMMKNSVKRADNIVRALLDFSRAEGLKVEQQDINTIIESSINLVQHKLKLSSIEPVCELGKDIPKTLMDRGKMEQVFVNLFNNAVDAMPQGGKLYVRSYLSELKALEGKIGNREKDIFRLGEKVIMMEVEDTGVGIDEDNINKIFDPFFTTKSRAEGTGLGLSVAKNILEIHNSLISVESKKGKGTKFTIVFKIPKKREG